MGGAIGEGNLTASAEFNIWADPEAAAIVLDCGRPVALVPLEVTHAALFRNADIPRLEALGTQTGRVFADLLRFFAIFHRERYGWDGSPIHDAVAVARLVGAGPGHGGAVPRGRRDRERADARPDRGGPARPARPATECLGRDGDRPTPVHRPPRGGSLALPVAVPWPEVRGCRDARRRARPSSARRGRPNRGREPDRVFTHVGRRPVLRREVEDAQRSPSGGRDRVADGHVEPAPAAGPARRQDRQVDQDVSPAVEHLEPELRLEDVGGARHPTGRGERAARRRHVDEDWRIARGRRGRRGPSRDSPGPEMPRRSPTMTEQGSAGRPTRPAPWTRRTRRLDRRTHRSRRRQRRGR